MVHSVVQHTAYKKGARGAAKKHADYIAGRGKNAGKEDVVFVLDGNLPKWAEDASLFFAAADEYERSDYSVKRKARDGTVYEKMAKGLAYMEFEWSIPRGIKDPASWAQQVAAELLGNRHVYRLAVHDAPASDEGRNINMHLMFSDRLLDGIERGPEQFFKRAKTGFYKHRKTGEMIAHDPATGGAAKDRFWNNKIRPGWVRQQFEKFVQLEIPDYRLVRSENPEPKIGPKLKKAGPAYEVQRRAVEALVLEMRALRAELAIVDNQLAAAEADAAPRRTGRDDPRWPEFERAFFEVGAKFGVSRVAHGRDFEQLTDRFTALADASELQGRNLEKLAALFVEAIVKVENEQFQRELEEEQHQSGPEIEPDADEPDGPSW